MSQTIRTSGPTVIVPDNPWSLIYRPAAIRHALAAIEEQGDDELAWRLYCDHGRDEATRALELAAKTVGPKFRRPKRKE